MPFVPRTPATAETVVDTVKRVLLKDRPQERLDTSGAGHGPEPWQTASGVAARRRRGRGRGRGQGVESVAGESEDRPQWKLAG